MSFTPDSSPSALLASEFTHTVSESCPLNSGFFVIDQLLAAATRCDDWAALDAALDFRLTLASAAGPEAIIAAFLALRDAVQERHYLACYRLRRWLESQVHAEVQLRGDSEPVRVSVRLDAANHAELCTRCLAAATEGAAFVRGAQLRFVRSAWERLALP